MGGGSALLRMGDSVLGCLWLGFMCGGGTDRGWALGGGGWIGWVGGVGGLGGWAASDSI